MSPERAIGYLLQHVSSVVARQCDQVLQEQLGIGMSQFKLLMILQHEPHIRQRQLADHLGQTEASISRQIKILQDKGLLETMRNPKNKREHVTVPTAKGMRITEAAKDAMKHYSEPMLASLGDKQCKQLITMLSALHDWTCQPGKLISCDHPFKI